MTSASQIEDPLAECERGIAGARAMLAECRRAIADLPRDGDGRILVPADHVAWPYLRGSRTSEAALEVHIRQAEREIAGGEQAKARILAGEDAA